MSSPRTRRRPYCILPPQFHGQIPGAPVDREQTLRRVRRTLVPAATPTGQIAIYDAQHADGTAGGVLLRDLSDPAAAEAHAGVAATRAVFPRLAITTGSAGIRVFIHYGEDYDNAFWDGTEMVFGDGDRIYFNRFTIPIDVCGHELWHWVTGGRLSYRGQAGALNEFISDMGGVLTKQTAEGLSLDDDRSWLIGEGLFTSRVRGVALRSLKAPGTAFDDPQFGRDDQPSTMSGFLDTQDDDGGVHTNSGIPNHAYYLASKETGDSFGVAKGFYDALGALHNPDATFREFAQVTLQTAGRYGDAVRQAWGDVEVLPRIVAPAPPDPAPSPPPPETGPPAEGGESPFRVALGRYPLALERLAERTTRHHPPMTEDEYAAWLVAGDLHCR